jgi:hypothetical protein
VVHHRDPVPHLPLRRLGYRHPAREVLLPEDDGPWPPATPPRICDGSGEDPICSNRFGTSVSDLRDHLRYLGRPIGTRCCGGSDANEKRKNV